ncbi:HIT family hydrolase, partial [Burkholderia multivorans]
MTTEDGQSDHLGEGKRTEPDLGMDLADIESASGFPGEPDGFQRLWTP